MTRPIFLFTDFGVSGFYVGQMHAAMLPYVPDGSTGPAIDLMHDAPAHNVKAASYLLAALIRQSPHDSIIVGVVDPGVGGNRPPVVIEVDGRVCIGPGNGLFEIAARQSSTIARHHLSWQPPSLSASFHGRDLFAPAAAQLAQAADDQAWRQSIATPLPPSTVLPGSDWPDDLAEVIYLDGFGNAMSGIRAEKLPAGLSVAINGRTIRKARTFSDVPKGEAFWYENSIGLIEVAVNQGRAAEKLGLDIGSAIGLV